MIRSLSLHIHGIHHQPSNFSESVEANMKQPNMTIQVVERSLNNFPSWFEDDQASCWALVNFRITILGFDRMLVIFDA